MRHATGFRAIEHRFEVPLAPRDGRTIEVFAREVRKAADAEREKPYLLQLNGGPGRARSRPTAR